MLVRFYNMRADRKPQGFVLLVFFCFFFSTSASWEKCLLSAALFMIQYRHFWNSVPISASFYMRVSKAFIELWRQDFTQEMCRTFGMHNAIENVSSSLDTFSRPHCLNVRCHSDKASSIWDSSAAISSLPRFWFTTETWTLQLPARWSSCCSEISRSPADVH